MIYLAAPYSHPDKAVVEERVKLVCQFAAYLMNEGMHNVSPITTGTGIFNHATLPSTFAFWESFSYALLEVCDTLFVLELPGWEESIGVTAEIAHAKAKGIKTISIDLRQIQICAAKMQVPEKKAEPLVNIANAL